MDPTRVARAAEAIRDGEAHVEPAGEPDTFEVRSFTGEETYTVRLEPEQSCTCPDSLYNGTTTCKHVAAALLTGGPNRKERA